MMNKLMNIWIGLIALSGVMIFFHSQELKNELQEDFFIKRQSQKMEKDNSFEEVEEGNIKQFYECNVSNINSKIPSYYHCKSILENQKNRDLANYP